MNKTYSQIELELQQLRKQKRDDMKQLDRINTEIDKKGNELINAYKELIELEAQLKKQ